MRILPYSSEYESALLDLERESPQGRQIQLQMVRDRFVDRSSVFDDHQVYVLVAPDGALAGTAAAAVTEIERDGYRMPAGICYDLRVKPKFRRQGLSKLMGRHIIEDFFRPRGIDRYFLTMKLVNAAVLRAAKSVLGLTYTYPFRYLTIPVSSPLRKERSRRAGPHRFSVGVAAPDRLPAGWYHRIDENTGFFETHRMYRIKVTRVAALARAGIVLAQWLRGDPALLPRQDDILRMATLCHREVPRRDVVEQILDRLRSTDTRYLLAVCQNNDPVEKLLGPSAVSSVDYLVVGNFAMHGRETFRIDVRCL